MLNLRLGAIDRVEGLVQEKSDSKGPVDPRRHILVHGGVVPQHCQEVDNDKAEARQCDLGTCEEIRVELQVQLFRRTLTALGLQDISSFSNMIGFYRGVPLLTP